MSSPPATASKPAQPRADARAERLRIGGFTPLTTIDYPGELAAVVFCQGCPWRCRYCHNGDLLALETESRLPWSDIRRFLERRIGLLDAVVFSGGEPSAQTVLGAAIEETRSLGYKIGLHTSGAYPDRLRQLLPLIDWVGLDIKALPSDYAAITGVQDSGERAWESLKRLLEAGRPLEVRTTLMPGWTPSQVGDLARQLADAGVGHYVLQACDRTRALDPHLPGQSLSPRELIRLVDGGRFRTFELRGDARG